MSDKLLPTLLCITGIGMIIYESVVRNNGPCEILIPPLNFLCYDYPDYSGPDWGRIAAITTLAGTAIYINFKK